MQTQVTTIGQTAQLGADEIFDGVFDRSLQFQIELDYDAVCQFIRRIDAYNEFQSGSVLDALDEIDRLIPRRQYGPGNPNNGERDYTLKIGREGSPVLYLERLEWGDKVQLTEDQMKVICSEMETIAMADEANFTIEPFPFLQGRRITFRFWWD